MIQHQPRDRRRLHFVVTHLAYGGAETQVVELAAEMVRRGWGVRVTSLMSADGLTDRLDALGVPWDALNVPRGRWSPRLVTGMLRILRAWRPDVLHTHTLPANFVGRVVKPLARVPVLVTSAHNHTEGGRARMLFYRLTDPVADLTTNCSEAAVERYIRIGASPAHRIRYVPNGIDTDRFAPDEARRAATRSALGLTPDTFAWLAVGRMEEQKDYPNLLAAAARALGPDDRLLVVGDGVLRPEVERRLAAHGLGDRVRLLGIRTDIPDLMRAADAFVMGSAWEGLPITLLEASASALPIVATDVGGNDQIVRPGQGFLPPARDAQALADAMRRLRALDPAERGRMGERARAHVADTFGMRAVADRWEAIYDELLAAR